MGIAEPFDGRIFNAYDMERGKPSSDIFLHAAACTGARPDRCAVIEDSLFGVQAGVAAGMRVFGYAPDSHRVQLASAGAAVFRDMKELLALLRC